MGNRIAGNIGCTNYQLAQSDEINSEAYLDLANATQPFYDSLASTVFSNVESDEVNYANAWLLYEYALYQSNHNGSAPISPQDLSQLYNLASQAEFELNTPNALGSIPSIAGQTFASVVLQQLQHNIASNGVSDKLTLLFGSYEPFLSFFALSNLSTGPSAQSFLTIPNFGSLMAFELYSSPNTSTTQQNASIPFPSTDELFVRFLFRNGTSDTEPLIEYSLFGRGNSQDEMSWANFAQGMGDFALNDVGEWCDVCNAFTLLFCEALESYITNGTTASPTCDNSKTLSPAIGGVIGAAVTLAVAILAAALLFLCGFRMQHRGRGGAEVGGIGVLKRSGSAAAGGGFKGAEKLASDTDLRLKGAVGASVVRHERAGSWELGEGPRGQGSLDKGVESGSGGMERVVSGADYGRRSEDEGVNPFGDPVKAIDQV